MFRLILLGVCVACVQAEQCSGGPAGPGPDCGSESCCSAKYHMSAGTQKCYDSETLECCASDGTVDICDKSTQFGCGCGTPQPTGAYCCDKNTQDCVADPNPGHIGMKVCASKNATRKSVIV